MSLRHAFPFTNPLADKMQRSVVGVIESPDFVFELPDLSSASWEVICNNNRERERLEFLGDSLIGAFVSGELFLRWPNEGPGFYTVARSVLTANSTFAHLMYKLGFHDINNPVKPAGDAFETMLAAFHGERGPDAFNEYVRPYFLPLIDSVAYAYYDYRSSSRIQRKEKYEERGATSFLLGNARARRKLRKQEESIATSSSPSTTARPTISMPSTSRTFRSMRTAEPPVKSRVVIDLTSDLDEDSAVETSDEDSVIEIQPYPSIKSSSSNITVQRESDSNAKVNSSFSSGRYQAQNILQSISVSPKKGGDKSSQRKKDTQDDLVLLFSQASLSLPGSIDNPITIE
ncbi:ribonuclease III domain-containing protein [Flammula alnicola]|nr:ribonuclease III domain-containing protein [Flammula alnicola]